MQSCCNSKSDRLTQECCNTHNGISETQSGSEEAGTSADVPRFRNRDNDSKPIGARFSDCSYKLFSFSFSLLSLSFFVTFFLSLSSLFLFLLIAHQILYCKGVVPEFWHVWYVLFWTRVRALVRLGFSTFDP